jgi:hypothetical protein
LWGFFAGEGERKMGSFDISCSLSSLPITVGTPIKMLLLSSNKESKYEDALGGFDPYGFWRVRTPPIDAIYNDYGRGKPLDGQEEAIALWEKGFDLDIVEQGVGDNTFHDVATFKGMNFEEILNAIHESRLFVKGEGSTKPSAEENGAPTLEKVSKILEGKDVYIDSIEPYVVRIRPQGYDEDEEHIKKLEKLKPLLKEFSFVITRSSSVYSHIEMLVFPDAKSKIYPRGKEEDIKFQVALCMVRKDVWDFLFEYRDQTYSVDYETKIKERMFQAFGASQDAYKLSQIKELDLDIPVGHFWPFGNEFYEAATIKNHFELLANQNPSDKLIESFAEFVQVNRTLSLLGKKWMPTCYAGQTHAWGSHIAFSNEMHKIAQKIQKEHDKE